MSFGIQTKEIQDLTNKLFSQILIEQQKFNKLRPPEEDKKNLTSSALQEYEQCKGRGFFFKYMSSGRGHGPFTELIDGSVKYDLIGGIGPNLLGHSHPLYIKAHLESAASDTVMCGNLLSYQEPFELSKTLLKAVASSKLKHFWLAGSGSFANDSALKMIWQKKAPKYKLIAFEGAFAGRSIATHNITHNPAYREGMPTNIDVDHIPHYDQQDPGNAIKKTIDALNNLWKKSSDYCAITIEIIQGEAGFVYGPREYYEAIFKWAKERDLYIWIDEVQTFGRTRELFAFQMLGLEEYVDIVTVGKALQVCGTLFSEELNPKPGLIAGTFNGSIAALNTSHKIVRYLTEGNFYGEEGRIRELEDKFLSRLNHLRKNSCKGKIGYVGGAGTMLSFEVGDSGKDVTARFIKKLFDNGIICFYAGKDPYRVRFLIPLSLTDEHIDEIFQIIENTVIEVVE